MSRSNIPRGLLEEAYEGLGFSEGQLFEAVDLPRQASPEALNWLEKGDWLALARRVGAERVFFVNNDPVIIFTNLHHVDDESDERALREVYRQAWCMARPQCLFVALPDELRVYALTQPPARDRQGWAQVTPLAIARRVADVAEQLAEFTRERIELGRTFAEGRFGDPTGRADKRLILDLKLVRRSLLNAGLSPRDAHALIGRSIFTRYLEDRGVITEEYFRRVAADNTRWQSILQEDLGKADVTSRATHQFYVRVLRDKAFTYRLFETLARDFNGDMFPRDSTEEESVQSRHLDLLRALLLGDAPEQQSLFFWAYDFSIVPIELVSSIYEEFYHAANDEDRDGTHYTPAVLVEDALSRLLTPERLAATPRVLDPACGSGIFLVEAFRRFVRFATHARGRRLQPDELRSILRDQIVGIEINREAIHVAAFSLYLALLNYQEPPDIVASKRLPSLIHSPERQGPDHYPVLLHSDAFALTDEERTQVAAMLRDQRAFAGRAEVERLLNLSGRALPLRLGSFAVVMGNPPWEELRDARAPSGPAARGAHAVADGATDTEQSPAMLWAKAFKHVVGDRSQSQLFIHRSLSLASQDGIVGLLVHASVLFNRRSTSQAFRRQWLRRAELREVVNYAHVRRLFFDKAVAPFVFVSYQRASSEADDARLVYLSARHTREAAQLRSVIFNRADRRIVRQIDLDERDYLWKTYWWGNHHDAALLAALDLEIGLRGMLSPRDPKPGYGFQLGSGSPSPTLRSLRPLSSGRLMWYGPLRNDWFEAPPKGVKRQPDERLYQGQRLLVVRGIKGGFGPYARLERDAFSIRHTIYCVPLHSVPEWKAKLVLGIFWSSLGRYRQFMTSGSWGLWYDQIVPADILSMPVRIPDASSPVARRITEVVTAMQEWDTSRGNELTTRELPPVELLSELNELILELFGLPDAQRDLVRDWERYSFDLFARGPRSTATQRVDGTMGGSVGWYEDLPATAGVKTNLESGLGGYLRAFLDIWNRELHPAGELQWAVVRADSIPMLGVLFLLRARGERTSVLGQENTLGWDQILSRCEAVLRTRVGRQIYVDGMLRAVTESEIVVLKRDERRLWTRSIGREDAEAALLQALRLKENSPILVQ